MLRLTLDCLVVLDAIDRAGSFASAAEELNRVPSAISYSVQKLEHDLGITIFDRGGHRATLTAVGRRLLEDGRALLDAARDLERAARGVASGHEWVLRVAIGSLVQRSALYSLLRELFEEEAAAKPRVHVEMAVDGKCWDALLSGGLDAVVGACCEPRDDRRLTSRRIGSVAQVLVAPPRHPATTREASRVERASGCARVVLTREQACSTGLPPSHLIAGLLVVDDHEAQRVAILEGLGIGYMPRHLAAADVAAGHLTVIEMTRMPVLPLTVAWLSDAEGPALRWLVSRLDEPATLAGLFRDVLDEPISAEIEMAPPGSCATPGAPSALRDPRPDRHAAITHAAMTS
jgi:DNA-binding transcriptional LysR family regulator